MFDRILIASDPLMTKEKEQYSNRRWLRDLLSRPVKIATGIDVGVLASSREDSLHLSRTKFFELSGISVDLDETQFWFSKDDISAESIEYLKEFVRPGDLVLGYELSEQTRYLLGVCGAVYVDIWLHPVRFMDDVLFGFNSNDYSVREKLFKFNVSEDLMYLYADRAKIQTYKGWRRVEPQLSANSALFVGQMLNDKSVCDDGKMLSVLDYKERFDLLCENHSKVYYARHPYLKSGDEDILKYLQSKKNVEIANFPVYRALSGYRLKTVAGLSSSVLAESKYFDKNVEYFYKPVFEYGSNTGVDVYSTVYQEFVSPHFWAEILGYPDAVKLSYFDEKDKIRDMLGFYWSYSDLDKVEFSRKRTDEVARKVSDLAKSMGSKAKSVKPLKPEKSSKSEVSSLPILPVNSDNIWNEARIKNIKKEIDSCKVVSFDVFDTLVERPFSDPADMFLGMKGMVEGISGISWDDFLAARKNSRNLALSRKLNDGEEISLQKRYIAVCDELGISSDHVDMLVAGEFELDKELCQIKHQGKQILDYAKSKNKKIILVSDIYYSADQVKEILKACGLGSGYKIYSSLDCGVLKHTGKLYKHVSNELKCKPAQIVHIGDNYKSDVTRASEAGWKAQFVPTSRKLCAAVSDYLNSFSSWEDKYSASVVSSLGAFRVAREQAAGTKSYSAGSPEVLGYAYLGASMVGFARQILDHASSLGVEKIFFLARDGDIVKRCYDIFASGLPGAPKSEYLYASRRAVNVACMTSVEDICNALQVNFTPCPINEILLHRFGVKGDSIATGVYERFGYEGSGCLADWKKDSERLIGLFSSPEMSGLILENAKDERDVLLQKYAEHGLVAGGDNYAFVDIGHSGSLQQSIIKLCGLTNTTGFYFSTNSDVDERINNGHKAVSYYADRIVFGESDHPYIKFILMFELMFQNQDGSFIRYDSQGVPEFLDVEGEKARVDFIGKVHSGIVSFAADVKSTIDIMGCDLVYNSSEAVSPYLSFLRDPWPSDASLLVGVGFENKYSGRATRWIIPPAGSRERGLWHNGCNVVHPDVEPDFHQPKWVGLASRFVKNDRKKAKLQRDPKSFLRDSKVPLARYLSRFVSE